MKQCMKLLRKKYAQQMQETNEEQRKKDLEGPDQAKEDQGMKSDESSAD